MNTVIKKQWSRSRNADAEKTLVIQKYTQNKMDLCVCNYLHAHINTKGKILKYIGSGGVKCFHHYAVLFESFENVCFHYK